MLIIEYDKNLGKVVPDAEAEQFAKDIYDAYSNRNLFDIYNGKLLGQKVTGNSDIRLVVSSELIITAFRVLIREQIIPHSEICFEFNGERLFPNRNGVLLNWPRGFCDTYMDLTTRLLLPPRNR